MEAIMRGCLDQANIAIVKWLVDNGAVIRLEEIGDATAGAWRIEVDADGTHVDVHATSEGSGIIVDGSFVESAGKAISMLAIALGLHESCLPSTLASKAVPAAARFLSRRGYEILEDGIEAPDGSWYVVAVDRGDVVFARVLARLGSTSGMPGDDIESLRGSFERTAASYCADRPDLNDMPVRCDVVSMVVINEDRALIRHHINAMA